MRDGNPPCVERVPREPVEGTAIHRVAGDGPAAGGQVHPDLMSSPRHETASKDGPIRARVIRQTLESRDAPRAVLADQPSAAIGGIGPERKIDLTALRIDLSLDDGEVVFLRFGPVFLKRGMNRRVLREDDDAGGQLVEAADHGQRGGRESDTQVIEQRAGDILIGGMDDQPGRLVDGQQPLVFE